MNTAGGSVQGDDAWPLPPLALPRGPREHSWHAALGLAVLLVVALPPLRLPVTIWTMLIVLTAGITETVVPPWLLRRAAATSLALAAVAGRIHLELSHAGQLLLDMLLRRDDLVALDPAVRWTVQGGLWAAGLLIVATIAGFDLRIANRQVVDERVWARQQLRRRQVMAQHHRRNPPPETL